MGLERSQDDDLSLIITGGVNGDKGLPDFGLFCVADGLGGYEHGSLASSIAIRTVARILMRGVFLRLLEIESIDESPPLDEMISDAFKAANQAVFELAQGGATTLTSALMLDDKIVIGHVGDTRAYLINAEKIEALTIDHSLVQRLVESGTLSEEEALDSPHRSVLWNAMGKTEDPRVDISYHAIIPNTYLMLCSDGLWDVVEDEEMFQMVSKARDPQKVCDALVRTANDAGGPDNVSVILVRFPSVK
ncbi:MAG TPA: serine/threonine-protein phosphatase [Anaerolineae bacterium]|nr:serine/threonine-protein phosphatase [Anaerolineae bacterium]